MVELRQLQVPSAMNGTSTGLANDVDLVGSWKKRAIRHVSSINTLPPILEREVRVLYVLCGFQNTIEMQQQFIYSMDNIIQTSEINLSPYTLLLGSKPSRCLPPCSPMSAHILLRVLVLQVLLQRVLGASGPHPRSSSSGDASPPGTVCSGRRW